MKWVTRTYPGVDRTASAWLIKRFIDPSAEFTFINWPDEQPRPEHGIPFDIKGVELGHHDNKCTFEVLVEKYGINDPYVSRIAEIVHSADIEGELDKSPEARGIKLLFNGLRFITSNDYETLEIGMKIWDAVYAALKLEDVRREYREELEKMGRIERLRFLHRLLKR